MGIVEDERNKQHAKAPYKYADDKLKTFPRRQGIGNRGYKGCGTTCRAMHYNYLSLLFSGANLLYTKYCLFLQWICADQKSIKTHMGGVAPGGCVVRVSIMPTRASDMPSGADSHSTLPKASLIQQPMMALRTCPPTNTTGVTAYKLQAYPDICILCQSP